MNPSRPLQLPMDDKKERNMQYQLVHALDDRKLVKKLLALPIKETTAKMLEVCSTHNAINSEMEALGLGSSKTIHAIHKGPQQKGQCKGHKPQQQQQRQQHSCRNCTKQHTWDKLPALQRTPNAKHVAKRDTGRPSVR